MAVSGVNNNSYTPIVSGQDSGGDAAKASLNYESFLKLLVAQMKNQDPTQPMDATQQIAQLATFSQVEQTIKTNKNLESLLQRTSLSEADAVIGRTVTSEDGKTTGVVKEVKLYSDGIIAVLDSGKELVIGPGVKVK
ncbi:MULTISPECIES: flagellar hook assembly protein FlgD [Sinorhizobium/Ensifer group]|uniref:flagellar hook assembly protein FlgD n=1 Tax=Sinorhizobium/Ensifer group TaxID=227292 RepID=UPI00070C2F24|nr:MULTISPECIES: flagellar hook assembly protein FlgD [Sinorhizobium/Ensifer group]KRD64460.1 flagellar basal body rod modification protein [Ensifer sp. Root278]KSV84855.1 flagellar basal body rod modification protein FlgD [Sinorhizobium sp. Sb3]KSV96031.1 flagellar basal body rod modification protein FlgD [Sinorhizobium sp. GL28]MBD9505745.1 flagellar hook assembly protein FlgD [Ensifer sp. ENS10]MBV7516417.1 flagellar hook assembly protein FlgD [Ensifer sp. ENS12]